MAMRCFTCVSLPHTGVVDPLGLGRGSFRHRFWWLCVVLAINCPFCPSSAVSGPVSSEARIWPSLKLHGPTRDEAQCCLSLWSLNWSALAISVPLLGSMRQVCAPSSRRRSSSDRKQPSTTTRKKKRKWVEMSDLSENRDLFFLQNGRRAS